MLVRRRRPRAGVPPRSAASCASALLDAMRVDGDPQSAPRPRQPPLLREPRRILGPRRRRPHRRPAKHQRRRRCGWPRAASPRGRSTVGRSRVVVDPRQRASPVLRQRDVGGRRQLAEVPGQHGRELVAQAPRLAAPRAAAAGTPATVPAGWPRPAPRRWAAGPSTRRRTQSRCSSSNGSPCHWMIRGIAGGSLRGAPTASVRAAAAGHASRQINCPSDSPAPRRCGRSGPCIAIWSTHSSVTPAPAGGQDHQLRDVSASRVSTSAPYCARATRACRSSSTGKSLSVSCCHSPPPAGGVRAHQQLPRLARLGVRRPRQHDHRRQLHARAGCTTPRPPAAARR